MSWVEMSQNSPWHFKLNNRFEYFLNVISADILIVIKRIDGNERVIFFEKCT